MNSTGTTVGHVLARRLVDQLDKHDWHDIGVHARNAVRVVLARHAPVADGSAVVCQHCRTAYPCDEVREVAEAMKVPAG